MKEPLVDAEKLQSVAKKYMKIPGFVDQPDLVYNDAYHPLRKVGQDIKERFGWR